MKAISGKYKQIVEDTQRETLIAREHRSLKRLKQMLKDAPPIISFASALTGGSAMIAEIKECSPSQGQMLPQNFNAAPFAYKESRVVKAISVLTNRQYFGRKMTLARMQNLKRLISKPVLRKDFITDEYQVYESRAFGADAILLMANILTADELDRLSSLATQLGMDVLFETHQPSELEELPKDAKIVGINCRNFNAGSLRLRVAQLARQWLWSFEDDTVDISRFDYAKNLPSRVIKVAESGVTVKNCASVLAKGFHAVLVGTSLLMDRRGIQSALQDFEHEIFGSSVSSQSLADSVAA